jgi:hypothetical protein
LAVAALTAPSRCERTGGVRKLLLVAVAAALVFAAPANALPHKSVHAAVTLSLRYQPANERARALYASMGFQETEERVDGEVVAAGVALTCRSPSAKSPPAADETGSVRGRTQ